MNSQLESQQKQNMNKNAQLKVQLLRSETEKSELKRKFEQQHLFSLSNEKSLSESQLKNMNLDGDEDDE